MNNYATFFDELKQFVVDIGLDNKSNIKGANDREIEEAVLLKISAVPPAYLHFLKVFGQQHAEKIFGIDLIVDSRAYDREVAAELIPDIADNNENIVIAERQGFLFYFIKTGSENPKVFQFSEIDRNKGIYEGVSFTCFIRELVFQNAESYRRYAERLIQRNSRQEVFDTGEKLDNELTLLREQFVFKMETIEKAEGLMSIETYLKQWKMLFESSNEYLENKAYYNTWGKPYFFKRKSFWKQIFS